MNKVVTDPKKIDAILDRGTIVQILPTKKEFRDRLLSGDRLRFYIGFDATAPTLHLSHAKNFMLMERLRQLGHEVIILFGDFTARIGDPSGETSARKPLSRDEVLANVKRWKELVAPFMDLENKDNPTLIKYNHEWLSVLTFEDIIDLASNMTVQQLLERDMFQNRLKDGKPIHLQEFLYPIMQGYDSVAMEVDAELCGTDQIFNALVGRTLLRKLKNKNKFVVAVTLMENPKTGELMSKSRGTGVFLDVTANDLYGQIMAQPDEMTEILFVNCTWLELADIAKIMKMSPYEAKKHLAHEFTALYKSTAEADIAAQHFQTVFSKNENPEEMAEVEVTNKNWSLVDLLLHTDLVPSKTEGRRLIEQGGVRVDGAVIGDREATIRPTAGLVIQVGKRKFIKIK